MKLFCFNFIGTKLAITNFCKERLLFIFELQLANANKMVGGENDIGRA